MAALGKKGLYFTLIAVLIVTVLVVGMSARTFVSPAQELPALKTRVQVADDYVSRLNDVYLERALYVSSYWALESIALYENKTGAFMGSRSEFSSRFAEVMVNGSIDGESIDAITGVRIMDNNTLLHRLGQIENASMAAYSIRTDFNKDISSFAVAVRQSNRTGPWRVSVNATFSYTVNATLARWDRTKRQEAEFEITGLHDPLILVRSSGRLQGRVEKANFTSWNVTKLYHHIANGTYRAEFNGTSFLDRFYNNMSKSECCGIESVLDPNKMGLPDTARSYADWCFYSARCPPNTPGQIWNVTGITSTNPAQSFYAFKLDDYHIVIYNVTGYN